MKGKPIPTRFDQSEQSALRELKDQTGLSSAEIIRRAVRLLAVRVKEEGGAGFILDELSPHRQKISYSAEQRKKRSSG